MYQETIEELLNNDVLDRQMRFLVVCGGDTDRDTLHACGLQNVVISNLDTRMEGDEFAPFDWSFQDAEDLTFDDGAFDFAICHWGLHHCYSPHRALLEMYRVAQKGVLFFEPYDNLMTRLGVKLNVGQSYEHAAVFYNDLRLMAAYVTHPFPTTSIDGRSRKSSSLSIRLRPTASIASSFSTAFVFRGRSWKGAKLSCSTTPFRLHVLS